MAAALQALRTSESGSRHFSRLSASRRYLAYCSPHALHSVFGPAGPRRHSGVSVSPQWKQRRLPGSGLALTRRTRFCRLAELCWPSELHSLSSPFSSHSCLTTTIAALSFDSSSTCSVFRFLSRTGADVDEQAWCC